MKALLCAAALAVAGAHAQAATYTFDFVSERTTFGGSPPDPADDFILGQEGIVTARIVLDLPSIRNASYFASFGSFGEGLSESIPGALVSASTSLTGSWTRTVFGSFGVGTDARGRLVAAGLEFASDTPDVTIGFGSVSWGDCCEVWYRGEGAWTVTGPDVPAPIPLPASLPLLGAGLAGLAMIRRPRR